MKKFVSQFKSLPKNTRRLLSLGIILALVAALPLFIWAILTQRFDLRKRASTGESPPPTPSLMPTPTPLVCATPPPCDGPLVIGDPEDGSCPIYHCPSTPTPSASPTGTPTPRSFNFLLRLGGVDGGEAEGAKATFRFVSGVNNFTTAPIELTHNGSGVYWAIFTPTFQNLLTKFGASGTGYTIYVKGEKHLANKFCFNTGQSGPCTGQGTITIPDPVETVTPTFLFTGFPLEPGDLPPQDGKVDSVDFNIVKTLMGKLCSSLTDSERAAGDLDYNGCINVADAFLLRKTLETRYDEF